MEDIQLFLKYNMIELIIVFLFGQLAHPLIIAVISFTTIPDSGVTLPTTLALLVILGMWVSSVVGIPRGWVEQNSS